MSSAKLEELRKKFDENPRRYFAPLANEYRKVGDFDQAIFICQEYLPQQPGHMSGHIVFGQALFEAKRLPEAKQVFETALSLDPENLIALRHLADISRGLGDTAAARTWYEKVLQADPRNEEIGAILEQMGSATAAAAAAPTAEAPAKAAPAAPAARTLPDAASAPTMELSAAAVQEMMKARQAAKAPATPPAPPPLANLDTTPTIEISAAGADTSPMEGLEPTSQAPGMMDLPAIEPLGIEPTSQAGMMDLPTDIQSIGVESNTAPGLHAEPEVAAPAPLDGLDTISLDLPDAAPQPPAAPAPIPEPAAVPDLDDGLLDLGSFSLETPAAAPPPPAPSPVETPIDGGHEGGDLLDLDFPAPAVAEAPPPPASSMPTLIIDAVKAVVPAVEDVVEATAPIVMDVVETVVDAVVETPTIVMEAIKPPAKAEPPAPTPAPTESPRPSQSIPFVTETMAQLYLSQGHRAEAIDIYRKLIEARPADTELKGRLAAIEAEELTPAPAPPPPAAPVAPVAPVAPAPAAAAPAAPPPRFVGTGPSVRTVLRELFGLDGSASYSPAPSASVPAEAGSIDMLFAADAVAEELSPLALAFDGGYVAPLGTIDELFAAQ